MAACLLHRGWNVTFYARRKLVGASLTEAGAARSNSIQELGRACHLVFLSLPDADAVDRVLFSQTDCLFDALRAGSCVVDTSTTSASCAREVGRRLYERGIHFLDAPVSGGQQAAAEGRLTCMVGGEASVLDACREALESFCRTILPIGPLGTGQAVKSCNQVAIAGALLGVADAVALAAAQGLDPYLMREALLQGTASSAALQRHAPRIIERQFVPGFRADLMRKDLRTALRSAEESNVNLSVTRLAEYLLDCLCTSGQHDWDWSAVALAAQWNNANARPESADRETSVDAARASVGG